MAAGSSSQQNFRKAVGALKDSTMVGMAKVNSEFKGLDVAILKATNHIEVLPKEKHVRKILDAVSASRPRADVGYCIHALARRLSKTRTWAVAIKTLIIMHRALREVDQSFREELTGYSGCRGHVLNLSHFKDDSSPSGNPYSLIYSNQKSVLWRTDHLGFPVVKHGSILLGYKTKRLDTPDLLEQLPSLQRLLFRLLACQPVGVARYNFLIQYALSIVAAESVRLYVAITDGVLNLVDKFFEMHRHDAVKALEIYKKSGDQAERLSEFFEICRGLGFGQGQKYVKIAQPPASFIKAMEEYVMEAPQTLMLPWRTNDDDKSTTSKAIAIPEANLETDPKLLVDTEEAHPCVDSPEISKTDNSESGATPLIPDLLSWDEPCQEASEPDDNISLALSTITTEELSNPEISSDPPSEPTGWELALTMAPGSNFAAVTTTKLGGGLDRLTLDSLYDVALTKTNPNGTNHIGMFSSNPFEDDGIAQLNYQQLMEMPQQKDAVLQYQHQQSNYAQMNEMSQQQEEFMQQYYQQMNYTQMTEMLRQQDLMQQQDQQQSNAHQMAVIPHQEEAFKLQQHREQSTIGHDSTNPLGNPFIEQESKPCPSQDQPSGLSLI
ncbi:unnamed protein product [Fraxinus pennsylvanica]|uniref:ENTH domain-containing protein n=1 Tax=Fraxinus pennsylvanica TaxID=56036 RepID=A0AAD1Z4D5_9LAMI|nr:unnamed protein product [Fraxinus pennsylvanica]